MDSRTLAIGLTLVLFVFPVVLIAGLNFVFRKRGGIGKGWGGALFVSLCWAVAMLLLMQKLDQFL